MLGFELAKLLDQLVVFAIGDLRIFLKIVKLIVTPNLVTQLQDDSFNRSRSQSDWEEKSRYRGRVSSRSKARQTRPSSKDCRNSSRTRRISRLANSGSDFSSEEKSPGISIARAGAPSSCSLRWEKSSTRGERNSQLANKRSLSIPRAAVPFSAGFVE